MTTVAAQIDPRVKHILDRLAELKDKRSSFDARAPWIAELVAPTRSFSLTKGANELRARTLRDPTGVMSNKRLAAFIYGDMLSEATPWTTPKLLARDPKSDEALWFEQAAIFMHDR